MCIHLFRIKFRLDDLGDITWYNDLAHLSVAAGREDFNDISESADVLFSCETFEVQTTSTGPILLFAAFAGYSIEFKVRQNVNYSMKQLIIVQM